ncbi:MAG TPA: metallophosphoesterase family protein [Phyllobacterium sp.]|nr:metallophosphoesterase family protein [Phyllobacterium sp.]
MRLLAFSDIHNNLVAVRKLRALEKNSFDVIIVAGDIGNESAADFFRILATFKCPVMYVYGNWDNELGYKTPFGRHCHLIQSNVTTIGNLSFTGFSGCPTNWGKNPIFQKLCRRVERDNRGVVDALKDRTTWTHNIRRTKAYLKYALELQSARNEALKLNRESICKAVKNAEVDPLKCVIITHERLTRLSDEIPGAWLHLFGHLHTFSERTFKTTKYVNVAALDRPVSVRPRAEQKWRKEDCRNFNAGNYTKIEIGSSETIKVQCVYLAQDYPNWIPLEDRRYNGIEWIPEEAKWTNASDPPIPQSEVWRSRRITKPHAPA